MSHTGLHEDRTRVLFNLPCGDEEEELAVNMVIKYLKRPCASRTGFTHSILRSAGFRGYWRASKQTPLVKEKVILFIVDYAFDFDDYRLTNALKRLKGAIMDAYRRFGREQNEVWIITERVVRYV